MWKSSSTDRAADVSVVKKAAEIGEKIGKSVKKYGKWLYIAGKI